MAVSSCVRTHRAENRGSSFVIVRTVESQLPNEHFGLYTTPPGDSSKGSHIEKKRPPMEVQPIPQKRVRKSLQCEFVGTDLVGRSTETEMSSKAASTITNSLSVSSSFTNQIATKYRHPRKCLPLTNGNANTSLPPRSCRSKRGSRQQCLVNRMATPLFDWNLDHPRVDSSFPTINRCCRKFHLLQNY